METKSNRSSHPQHSHLDSLKRLASDSEPDIDDYAREAKDNPILSNVILKAVNASTRGLQRTVSSPEHAATLLGASNLQGLVKQLLQDQKALEEVAKNSLPTDQQ